MFLQMYIYIYIIEIPHKKGQNGITVRVYSKNIGLCSTKAVTVKYGNTSSR